jgi:two-component system chemotaxis response regulator CheY
MKVLIVDDSSFMRTMLKSLLKQVGLTDVFEASNGEEGLEALRKTPAQLVLLDLHMPVLDGLGFLRAAKADPALKDIPVVVVTSDTEKSQIDEVLKSGACCYMTKPFRVEGLREALSTALPGRH